MNIVAIVPAEYKTKARLFLYMFNKTVDIHDTLESIFSIGVSATGENPPTHYIYCREMTEELVEKQIIDQQRAKKACEWVADQLTTDKEIALSQFALMPLSKEDALLIVELNEVG